MDKNEKIQNLFEELETSEDKEKIYKQIYDLTQNTFVLEIKFISNKLSKNKNLENKKAKKNNIEQQKQRKKNINRILQQPKKKKNKQNGPDFPIWLWLSLAIGAIIAMCVYVYVGTPRGRNTHQLTAREKMLKTSNNKDFTACQIGIVQ